jgi:4-aminobutyrate aminotransferase-like enzyme
MTRLLGTDGDFPGVAPADEAECWLSVCPNPAHLLGLPDELVRAATPTTETVHEQRDLFVGKALSLSYNSPLHIVRGQGTYLYSVDGGAWLDCVNNVCHVGHCNPRVAAAAARQMSTLNTNTRYLHDALVEYAALLTATLPDPLTVCFFVNSGSEANDLAIRLARVHGGSTGVGVLDHAYHGNLSSLIDISPYKFNGPGGSGKPDHVAVLPIPDLYRGVYRDDAPRYLDEAEAQLTLLAGSPYGVSAFFAESMAGCAGQVVYPPGYLRAVYDLARNAGAVCVADEVQVGFGRVGSHFWGFETQGVVPDIVTMGKPMGNGHPIGAVVTTRAIADSFANGMEYFNSYGGNPVSCVAGAEVLRVIRDEHLQEKAHETGEYLLAGLRELQGRYPLVGDVRGRGLFIGVELVDDEKNRTPAARQASVVVNRMKEKGVLLSTDGPDHNVIKIKPPLTFGRSDADLLLSRLTDVLQEDATQPAPTA